MEFDRVYNVRCSLSLQSGREVSLDKLTQSWTYASLIEGTPNKESNDIDIRRLLDRARKDPATMGEPYLIEPERRDYRLEKGDMQTVLDQQRDLPEEHRNNPEWLPHIECVGIFSSISPARDLSKDESLLTIVWFQDDFGIVQSAVERLRSVDWDRHAVDCEWDY